MTANTKEAERREKARVRAERYCRRKGITPKKPAAKPWLAEGISRSTWYRRGNRVGDNGTTGALLDRLDWMLAELRASLDRAAAAHAVTAAELAT